MSIFDPMPSSEPLYNAMMLRNMILESGKDPKIPKLDGFGGWIIMRNDGGVFGKSSVMALFATERDAADYKNKHLTEEWFVVGVDIIWEVK